MKKLLFVCFSFLIVAQTASAQPAIQNVRIIDKTTATRAVSVSASGAMLVDSSGGTQPISAVSLPLPTGASTSALQSTGNASLGTIDTSTAAGAASLAVVDDWDESDRAKVNIIVGQAGVAAGTGTDSATTQRVSLATNVSLPAGTNAIGKLSANSGVDIGDVDVLSIAAGNNNIGDVDVASFPADPFGLNADAASATGSISAKLRFIAVTGIPITGTVTVGAHAVTNAGTFVTQENGALLTSSQLIDDVVHSGDAVLSKYAAIGGVLDDTATVTVTENQAQSLRITGARGVHANLRNNAGTEIGTSGNPIRTDPTGATSQPVNQSTAASLNAQVVGEIAHDAADSGNPVKIGGKVVTTALPTAAAANDRANIITDRFGRALTSSIDPGLSISKSANYTTTQTGAAIWDPTLDRIAINSIVVGSYGTTACRLILWVGANADTTYSAGTDQLLFAASFAPSSTSKPGLVFTPTTSVFTQADDFEVHATTDAGCSVDIAVHGYEYDD